MIPCRATFHGSEKVCTFSPPYREANKASLRLAASLLEIAEKGDVHEVDRTLGTICRSNHALAAARPHFQTAITFQTGLEEGSSYTQTGVWWEVSWNASQTNAGKHSALKRR
jgi:hypothetical protein